jgi:hypothetical protein
MPDPTSNQSLSKPSLLNIPREIRDAICIEVLQSPTGRVTFIPTNPDTGYPFKIIQVDEEELKIHGITTLALVQTCKQIHNECSNLFWKLNTVVLWPDILFTDWKKLRVQEKLRFQHVVLRFDLISPERWGVMALLKLGEWAKRGALKSVTIGLINPECTGLIYKYEAARKAFKNHLGVLAKLGGRGGDLEAVERKIVLDARKQNRIAPSLNWIDSLEVVLEQVHDAFGGELWINEELSYGLR